MASLILHAKTAIHSVGRKYINHLCQDEAANQTPSHNERPIEFGFAMRCMAEQHPTTVLDVGTGTTAWPHLLRNCGYVVAAVDNVKDYWPVGMQNRHWPVENVDITNLNGFKGRSFDTVTCISVIEHITDHRAAMVNMLSLLAPGGRLILTTPYSHFHPHENTFKHTGHKNFGKKMDYICRSHGARHLQTWLDLGARLERRELWSLFGGDLWGVGGSAPWHKAETENDRHQLGCFEFSRD